ncbi:MAG: sensor domain-containing diguanylate cyclase [Gammaproteobacteria bacterium]|jgi:diguanylate cyclase (GGDEF)-like protein|nr:sensor domain-containing diguanylate cyclase [Gammaproteobacteria bacterium]
MISPPGKALSLAGLFRVYTWAMVVVFALSLASYLSLRTTVKTFETITEREFVELRRLFYLQDTIRLSSTPISQYVAWGNADEAALFDNQVSDIEDLFGDILKLEHIQEEQRALIEKAREEWRRAAAVGHALYAIPPDDKADLRAAEDIFINTITATVNTLYEAHNIRIRETERDKNQATQRHRTNLILTAVIFAGGICFFFFASYVLSMHIIRPLRTLHDGIRQIGAGDLSCRIDLDLENEVGELARGINTMAKRLQQDQIELAQLAIRDSLTGLYNRREFERLLGEELHRSARYHHPLSLLLIDIDKFKEINDGFGHRAGDRALKMVSAAIRDISRKGDVVARYGGDELAVLLPETPIDDAMVLAERIRNLTAGRSLPIGTDRVMQITLSIGVAMTAGEITTSEQLIDAADQAMYVAKADGRNCVRRADPAGGHTTQRTLPITLP